MASYAQRGKLAARPGRRDKARLPGHATARLLTIVICQFMIGLDSTVVNIALPKIRAALHFTPTSLAWVVSAYILAFGGLLLLGGRTGDILGRRRMFMSGLSLFAVASLFGGLATSAAWLLAARVAQGVGAAFAAPSALALVTANFREGRERDRALAVVTGSYAASLIIGLIAGGMITAWGSWRWVMFVLVGGGLFWLSRVSVSPTYAGAILVPLIIMGLGVGSSFTAVNEMILSGVSGRDSGAASSLLEAMQWLGSVLGLSILVTVFGAASRHAAGHLPPGLNAPGVSRYVLVHGMSAGFIGGIGVTGLALVVTLLGIRQPAVAENAAGEAATTAAAEAGAESGVPAQPIRKAPIRRTSS
jgi:MFS family permease